MQWPEIGLSVEKKEFEEPRAEKCENPDISDYMTLYDWKLEIQGQPSPERGRRSRDQPSQGGAPDR